jgi:hypothetical protein
MAALLYLVAPLALASIYRCSDGQGAPLFSQFPCATSRNVEARDVEAIVITSISVVTPAQLTPSEQATLARIKRQFERGRATASSDQQHSRRRSNRRRAERGAICTKTRRALKSLRERKRDGYSLSAARGLQAEQQQLKTQISEHC